ncbi:MAG: hypothetical protein ACMXYK_03520 [Candidatus Woesearchaeota archaeon]
MKHFHKSKKGSILIVGVVFAVIMTILAIFIFQTAEKIAFDSFAGEAAFTLTEYRQASYIQRFYLEHSADVIVAQFNQDYVQGILPVTYDDFSRDYIENLFPVFNEEINNRRIVFNTLLERNVVAYTHEIPELQYSLYLTDGVVAMSSTPIILEEEHGLLSYWPHLKVRNSFFMEVAEAYEAKERYLACMIINKDQSGCLDALRNNLPEAFVDISGSGFLFGDLVIAMNTI